MTPIARGLVVAAVHVAIVGSVGAKLLLDRATQPRVWARTAPYDPELPIRGRYVSLRLEAVPARDFVAPLSHDTPVALTVHDGALVATLAADGAVSARISLRGEERIALIAEPVAYFIPEHVPDPSVRQPGEELWVEVTVPRRGPPRPIRLGVRRNGTLTPLLLD